MLAIVANLLSSVRSIQHVFLIFFISYFIHCLGDLIAEIQQGLWKKPPLALTSVEGIGDACKRAWLGVSTINGRHLGIIIVSLSAVHVCGHSQIFPIGPT